jgi:hypothetical protein
MNRRDERPQACDRQGLVAVLRTFVAGNDRSACGPVRHADGAFRTVLVLPARSSGPQGFENQIRFMEFRLLRRIGQAAYRNEPVLPLVAGPETASGSPLHAPFPGTGERAGSIAVDGYENGRAACLHFCPKGKAVFSRFLPHDLDNASHRLTALGKSYKAEITFSE